MKRQILFTVLAVGALFISSASADWFNWGSGERGSGDIVDETREVDDFDRIETNGSLDLEVVVGETKSVVVWIDDNLQDNIITEVRGRTLIIDTDGSYSSRRGGKVEISIPKLESVRSSGSGDISVERIEGDEFEFRLAGSGDFFADGEVERLRLDLAGSGDIDTRRLKAKDAKVRLKGSGDIAVYASEWLDAKIYGSGDIDYWGNPRTSNSIYGSGDITRRR